MACSQIRLKLLPSVHTFFNKLVHVKVEGMAPHKSVELRSKVVDDRGDGLQGVCLLQSGWKRQRGRVQRTFSGWKLHRSGAHGFVLVSSARDSA